MMTLDEAIRVARDKATAHSTVTFDLAAKVLGNASQEKHRLPRHAMHYSDLRQLAEIKAAARRMCVAGSTNELCDAIENGDTPLRQEFYSLHWHSAMKVCEEVEK